MCRESYPLVCRYFCIWHYFMCLTLSIFFRCKLCLLFSDPFSLLPRTTFITSILQMWYVDGKLMERFSYSIVETILLQTFGGGREDVCSEVNIRCFLRIDHSVCRRYCSTNWRWCHYFHSGETFFECAERKVADETGNSRELIKARAVVHVWNTFFPTSNWDKQRKSGYEGSQTVNLVILCDLDAEVSSYFQFIFNFNHFFWY